MLVLGSGADASDLRVTGGGDDAASVAIRGRAARLEGAPIVVPAAAGIAVIGTPVLAGAVVRALVLQLAMTLPPGELRLVGPLRDENAWAEHLPHRRAGPGRQLALGSPGHPVAGAPDIAIVRVDPAASRPPGCGVILTVRSPGEASLDAGGEVREIAVEALGSSQALTLARRAHGARGRPDGHVGLAAAGRARPAPERRARRDARGPCCRDRHRGGRAVRDRPRRPTAPTPSWRA